ncbi:hypothetical protein G6F43_005711 [Rhizopus delemar]|nr:hypothetical protein G6F43_005711 [Rhizopus delemar]
MSFFSFLKSLLGGHEKRDVIKEQQTIRKREKEKKQKNPRRLAPKQSILDSVKEMDLIDHQEMDHSIDILDCMDYTKPTPLQLASGDGCSKQASIDPHCTKAQKPEENKSEPVIELLTEDDRQPSSVHCCDPTRQPAGDRNAASACLGPPAKNDQGETIRLVTCRCGDDCACIGCDAHPSRAMKEGKKDVYVGFSETRRLSVVSLWPIENQTSSFLSQEGCGCSKRMENCSECLLQLWYPDFV